MSNLSPSARSLLADARGGDLPTERDRIRHRDKLALALGGSAFTVGSQAVASGVAKAGASSAWSGALGAAKWLVGIALVGTGGGTLAYVADREPHLVAPGPAAPPRTELHAARPAPTGVASLPPSPVATEGVLLASNEPKARAQPAFENTPRKQLEKPAERVPPPHEQHARVLSDPPSPAAPPVRQTTQDSLVEETALLREAQSALSAGDLAGAVRALDAHAKKFPHGALATERDGGRILVGCAKGADESHRRAAMGFVAAAPRSPLAARIRSACGL